MEVDTNELLSRIGAVLRGISNKLDRLIELGEKAERASRSQEMPEARGEHQGDHFVGAGKMVADEQYRQPVLPADVGKPCEFSITGKDWYSSSLSGFEVHINPWISSDQGRWNFARIKKDA